MHDRDTDTQILHVWKIETVQKQKKPRLRECDIWVSTYSCDAAWKRDWAKSAIVKPNFSCKIPDIFNHSVFSEYESSIENDIPSIWSDILGISSRKKRHTILGLSRICDNRLS